MIHALAILFIGFSLFSALSLALGHFRREEYHNQPLKRLAGILLLASLGLLQWSHFMYLQYDSAVIHSRYYSALLFSIAPIFYVFATSILRDTNKFNPLYALHFLPVVLAILLPFPQALPLSFALGALYLAWLAKNLYSLRQQRRYFRLELGILGGVILIALMVMLLGFALPFISEKLFFGLYACAIGMAFLLLNLALSQSPELSVEIAEAAHEAHHSSSLNTVDCKHALQRLDELMQQQQLFQQPDLNLRGVAEQLGLSAHQLSELINTYLGKGFSRYIREFRVALAKQQLLEEKSASVLAIGMSVGFSSQSNFYHAFREITGMTPGRYRRLHRKNTPK